MDIFLIQDIITLISDINNVVNSKSKIHTGGSSVVLYVPSIVYTGAVSDPGNTPGEAGCAGRCESNEARAAWSSASSTCRAWQAAGVRKSGDVAEVSTA